MWQPNSAQITATTDNRAAGAQGALTVVLAFLQPSQPTHHAKAAQQRPNYFKTKPSNPQQTTTNTLTVVLAFL